jgi:serine/threonine protein kinase
MESLHEQLVIGECYILQTRIAEDSCSEHWIATAIFSASKFLLRFINPELIDAAVTETLRRESLRSYNIRGPVVKDCIEIEVFDGRIFISSEYDGEIGLDRYLSIVERLSLKVACRCVESLARGLQSFHEYALVFGNLSPENILVANPASEQPGLIILKPGLSTLIATLEKSSGAALAVFAFLSPEYKQGSGLYPGSDVYSLGVVFFRLLAGTLPYPDGSGGAKTELASPRYVACVLFTIGVPERLIRIVVRMLIPDVSRRYASCLDFLRDLSGFLLAAPTDTGQAADLPYIRTFDSTGYFRSLKTASAADVLSGSDVPSAQTADSGIMCGKVDLRITDSERGWSVDDYIDFAREVVLGIHRDQKNIDKQDESDYLTSATNENKSGLLADSAVPVADGKPSVETSGQSSFILPAVHMLPADGENVAIKIPGENLSLTESIVQVASAPPSVGSAPLLPLQPEVQRIWTHHRIRVQDVYPIVSRLAARARQGKGSFRYIQEPESGYANTTLYSSLESLSDRCLYVNAGSCARYGTASTTDFLSMFTKAIANSLMRESTQSRAYIARKVSAIDGVGFLSAAFSGVIQKSCDDRAFADVVSSDSGFADYASNAICAFARKTKPLVLVIRGGERIQRDLHDLFVAISRKVPQSPVCVIVFYERIRFPSWHVLARYLPEKEI